MTPTPLPDLWDYVDQGLDILGGALFVVTAPIWGPPILILAGLGWLRLQFRKVYEDGD